MGCAGKGLDLLFSEISDVECDYRVSDVLGDVVCGGFSVPARKDDGPDGKMRRGDRWMQVHPGRGLQQCDEIQMRAADRHGLQAAPVRIFPRRQESMMSSGTRMSIFGHSMHVPRSPVYPSKTYRALRRPLLLTNAHMLHSDMVTSPPRTTASAC